MKFKFNINQIVKGKACGTFVVLGYREIAGKWFVQVKVVHDKTHEPMKGEMALEEECFAEEWTLKSGGNNGKEI